MKYEGSVKAIEAMIECGVADGALSCLVPVRDALAAIAASDYATMEEVIAEMCDDGPFAEEETGVDFYTPVIKLLKGVLTGQDEVMLAERVQQQCVAVLAKQAVFYAMFDDRLRQERICCEAREKAKQRFFAAYA